MMEQYEASFVRIARGVPDGMELVKGKMRKKTKLVEYFKLKTGKEIEIYEWAELAMAAVEADGMLELYERIRAKTDELRWLNSKKEKEKRLYALECLYGKSYEYWPDFTIIWA
ncbi:MAG: hypothetical protein MJ117_04320 [Lachnospiraceae bacterium]|nr:hypothetical protein [Lachnospiraceae bacterium]